ncbi:MAG TPA: prolyl oligopeptidase family serine peptidase [Rhizomicrobium sp.]|jgi:prolyl oligopeptidase|nr:prolyl oligopeptidase family serine peptidase [Rhizomicrobium sp.]
MHRICIAIFAFFICGFAGAGSAPAPPYPPAPRGTVVDHYFGTAVPDPYRWMENSQDPELRKWVDAENRLTEAYMARNPIRPWIAKRLTGLWNLPGETTPVPVHGPRLFFRRNAGLQNQSVLYVQDSSSSKPRVLVDPNVISPDGSVALSAYWPSPDGKRLAYGLSPGGGDRVDVHVIDVASGKELPDVVHWLKTWDVAWTNDDKGFFYARFPRPKGDAINQVVAHEALYYHALGAPQSADRLIYARPDLPRWLIAPDISDDGRYLFVVFSNGTAPANELYMADLGDPLKPDIAAPLKPVYLRNDAYYTPIDVRNGELYMQTTLGAPRWRIVAAKLSDPDPGHWRPVVPEGKGVLQMVSFTGHRLAVNTIVDAAARLDLYDTDGNAVRAIALPAFGTIMGISGLQDSNILYYSFSSYLSPTSTYRYDVQTGKTETVFSPAMTFDSSKYETREVFYPSKDGSRVPMFILAAKDVKLDGKNPTILYGYGGFDSSLVPFYKPPYPLWMELGGILAVPQLRGGDTYGEAWHRAGMLDKKQNSFDDFAWAAKYLIEKGYTSSKHLGIQGKSNGGLLIGASITQHPELFGAAYIEHGVLDMLRREHFSGGQMTDPEYGSANDPRSFKWLYAYSPLQRVKDGMCYPPTLISNSWDDDRVVPMHAFKFTAALQHAQGCANPILLWTTGATAHSYMPTDQAIQQYADVWAFEGYYLGMTRASIPHLH